MHQTTGHITVCVTSVGCWRNITVSVGRVWGCQACGGTRGAVRVSKNTFVSDQTRFYYWVMLGCI